MEDLKKRGVEHIGIAVLFALVGLLLIVGVTGRYSLGASPDSISYLEVSKNLRDGRGLVDNYGRFENHWPPLYPTVLAVTSRILDMDGLEAGKWVNAISLFFFFILFNLILAFYRPNNLTIIAINVFLLFTSVRVFTMLWSEGVFIVLLLATVLLYLKYIESKRVYLLGLVGILAGLMALTRYAAVGFIGGILLHIMLGGKGDIRHRIANIGIITLPFLVIFGFWLWYSHLQTSQAVGREIAFHPVTASNLRMMVITFVKWVFPSFTRMSLVVLLIVMTTMLINYRRIWASVSTGYERFKKFHIAISFVVLSYIVFLLLSISFIDAHTPLVWRILSPLYPFLALLVFPLLQKALRLEWRNLSLTILGVLIFCNTAWSFENLYCDIYYAGQSYTGEMWVNSKVLNELEHIKGKGIYTNGHDVIKLYYPDLQSNVERLPAWVSPGSMVEDQGYSQELNELRQAVCSGERVLIYFDNVNWRYYLTPRDTILSRFPSSMINKYSDGFIVRATDSNACAEMGIDN